MGVLLTQLNHYSAKLLDFDVGHPPKPCVFPDNFSLQRDTKIVFQREPILLETTVDTTMDIIKEEIYKPGSATYRVPPVAITSMARSGKTTLLHALFNKLIEDDEFSPILLDFNGNGNFEQRSGETDYDAFLRWVATSVLYKQNAAVPKFTCRKRDLEEYLKKSPKPIVLLVDEINCLNNNISVPLAKLLRRTFLDKADRYLCFTSHWLVRLDKIAGKTSSPPSPRTAIDVPVPHTQKVEEINKFLGTKKVTRLQVAQYMGSVGLLVSIFGSQRFNTTEHFELHTGSEFPLESFLYEFCKGTQKHDEMRPFDKFTSRLDNNKLVWPLCFAKEFLYSAGESDLHCLIDRTETVMKLQSSGSGLEWEYVVTVAIGVIARCSEFRNLTHIEATVLGVPFKHRKSRNELHIVRLPEKIKDPKSAKDYLTQFIKQEEFQQHPFIVMAYPAYTHFEVFDTITCFKESETGDIKFTGHPPPPPNTQVTRPTPSHTHIHTHTHRGSTTVPCNPNPNPNQSPVTLTLTLNPKP